MEKGVNCNWLPERLDDRKAGPMGYDVVIVGAGPAGAVLAYLPAKAGAEVLLLEKKVFPRYKACGGGLTQRALDSLPFEVDEVIEERVHTVAFIRNECAFELSVQHPVISMVMRDRFDHFLVKKSLEAGVHFQEGAAFKDLRGKAEALKVETLRGFVETRFVVGADGVSSRSMTLKNLKMTLLSYLEAGGVGSSVEVRALRFHLVPYGPGKKRPLACERGLIVGDATGVVDPITGEGISYALEGLSSHREFSRRP